MRFRRVLPRAVVLGCLACRGLRAFCARSFGFFALPLYSPFSFYIHFWMYSGGYNDWVVLCVIFPSYSWICVRALRIFFVDIRHSHSTRYLPMCPRRYFGSPLLPRKITFRPRAIYAGFRYGLVLCIPALVPSVYLFCLPYSRYWAHMYPAPREAQLRLRPNRMISKAPLSMRDICSAQCCDPSLTRLAPPPQYVRTFGDGHAVFCSCCCCCDDAIISAIRLAMLDMCLLYGRYVYLAYAELMRCVALSFSGDGIISAYDKAEERLVDWLFAHRWVR